MGKVLVSNVEEQKRLTKPERQKRINTSLQIQKIFTYLLLGASLAGWVIAVGSYIMYLQNGALYPEAQSIVGVALVFMVGSSRRTLRYYFRRLPWYASAIPIAILIYGLWHFVSGFGALNEMPPDLRILAKYHQMIFAHCLFISGHTFYCFLWSYLAWEQKPRKKRR